MRCGRVDVPEYTPVNRCRILDYAYGRAVCRCLTETRHRPLHGRLIYDGNGVTRSGLGSRFTLQTSIECVLTIFMISIEMCIPTGVFKKNKNSDNEIK